MAAYDVGYGKPPKKNQFKKGQSGNPKGRKKKQEVNDKNDLRSLFLEAGSEVVELNGRKYTKQELVCMRAWNDAAKGKDGALYPLMALGKTLNAFDQMKSQDLGGVLVVPEVVHDEDEWEKQASASQAKFRENTQEDK